MRVHIETRGINEEQKQINCENCNVELIRRYNISVAFKGSGFYTTDKKEK
jgi:predicted nucleic acid-binding Zn ribbon protein